MRALIVKPKHHKTEIQRRPALRLPLKACAAVDILRFNPKMQPRRELSPANTDFRFAEREKRRERERVFPWAYRLLIGLGYCYWAQIKMIRLIS